MAGFVSISIYHVKDSTCNGLDWIGLEWYLQCTSFDAVTDTYGY
jgi:hypothetical protein